MGRIAGFDNGQLCAHSTDMHAPRTLPLANEARRLSGVAIGGGIPKARPLDPLRKGVVRGDLMSLDVPPALLQQAERGEVDEAEFIDCVRTSLPYAWDMISNLVAQLKVDGGPFADNTTPPPDEQARGQLLRALASDAIRGALQRHFGVRLAFQNCHRVAVFPLDGPQETLEQFTSVRSQILNQSPELRDC